MEHNQPSTGPHRGHENSSSAEYRDAQPSIVIPDPAETDSSVAVTDSPEDSPAPDPAMAGKPKTRNGSKLQAVRYEDAADAAPPVVVAKVPKPSEMVRDVASTDGPSSSAGSTRSGSGSGNGKIANLRATFEKGTGGVPKDRHSGGSFSSVKRRFTSNDKLEVPNGKANGHGQPGGKEVASLKEDLERERELCQAYVDKCAMLEEEAVKLRHVYDEKCTFLIEEADQRQHTLHREAEQQRTVLEEKYAALVDKAQERRETFEERYAVLEHEVEELRTKVQQHSENDSRTNSPYSERSSADRTRAEDEVSMLRRQLADMKRNISMSTRMDGQVTDSVFAQETGVVHHELQNWIVNNFRRAKADIAPQDMRSRLDEVELTPGQRHQLRPMYAAYEPSMKLVMYQATATCLFMDIFNDESLYGLPEDLPWRLALREAVNKLEHVLGPAAHNKWRAVTVDVIRQSEGMQQYIETAARSLAEKVCAVLTAITQVEGNGTRLLAMTGIVKRAIELQHLFRVQRARYQFDLPSTSDLFYAEVMENISVELDTPIDTRVVKCATFPSVMKIGDELGDNVHLTNVIVKAKVVCS